MNKIRKELINILSDYMEKELEIWLIYKSTTWIYCTLLDFNNKLIEIERDLIFELYWDKKHLCKILGHYDISAVLKYVAVKIEDNFLVLCPPTRDNNEFSIHSDDWWDVDDEWTQFYIFPNKPLNLYTEKEEKDLLLLLNNLNDDS